MASWIWILIFLGVATAIVCMVLWASGILSAANRSNATTPPSGTDASNARENAEHATAPARSTVARSMPVRSSVPPPAMAGPAPALATDRGQAVAPTTPAPQRRSAAPPPAAAAGPSAAVARDASSQPASRATPPQRSSKPPPILAAVDRPTRDPGGKGQ